METLYNVSKNDQQILSDIVDNYADEKTLDEMSVIARKFFIQNITPNHYIYLGWLIGQRFTARIIVDRYINNLKPCQRQN